MAILEITPIHRDSHCCLEDNFVSLAHWLGREYVLMYAESWDFGYRSSNAKVALMMGNRILAGGDHCWNALARYHGIKTEWFYQKNFSEAIKFLQDELQNIRPILICIDAYWLPWTRTYQMQHAKHFVLAIGFDAEQQLIKCIDSFITKEICDLPGDHFEKGNAKLIKLIIEEDKNDFELYEIITRAVARVREPKEYGRNSFEDMLAFAHDIEVQIDLKLETKDSPIPFLVPLFFQLRYLGMGRVKFAETLKYLAECNKII